MSVRVTEMNQILQSMHPKKGWVVFVTRLLGTSHWITGWVSLTKHWVKNHNSGVELAIYRKSTAWLILLGHRLGRFEQILG